MKKISLYVISIASISLLTNCNSNKCLIKFESNGGTLIAEQKVKMNERVIKPDDPTKNGYTFGKWYTDENLTNVTVNGIAATGKDNQ